MPLARQTIVSMRMPGCGSLTAMARRGARIDGDPQVGGVPVVPASGGQRVVADRDRRPVEGPQQTAGGVQTPLSDSGPRGGSTTAAA